MSECKFIFFLTHSYEGKTIDHDDFRLETQIPPTTGETKILRGRYNWDDLSKSLIDYAIGRRDDDNFLICRYGLVYTLRL